MDQDRQADEQLMRQVALGGREHLRVLLRRYANPLLTFIQRMVGDRHLSAARRQVAQLAHSLCASMAGRHQHRVDPFEMPPSSRLS